MSPTQIWRFNVALTDFEWFSSLRDQRTDDEVNFWQPSPTGVADKPGTPWLFKLHSPRNFIVGGAFFVYYARLPVAVAWETFGPRNGALTFDEMLARVAKYRKVRPSEVSTDVGCVVLGDPFFFDDDAWIAIPPDWSPNIVRGKHYSLNDDVGARLWREVALRMRAVPAASPLLEPGAAPAVGKPLLVLPRLGQAAFRIQVLDAYDRRCAVTGERTLPALEAAHIKPFSIVKTHETRNGLLLRSDIHHLFDFGYVTVTPDLRFEVSRRIREEFENGRDYYALNGKEVRLPLHLRDYPDRAFLEWHAGERFRK
jgi:putative restriction endonuclease